MNLVVEDLDNDAAEIRLTSERIRTIAESRLRAARLYDANSSVYLYVRISLLNPAFVTEVAFNKMLLDAYSKSVQRATTWQDGRIGRYHGGAGFILQGLSELLDRFILDYLRVNEDACNPSPGR